MCKHTGIIALLMGTASGAFGDWKTVSLKYEVAKDGFRGGARTGWDIEHVAPANLIVKPPVSTKHPVYSNVRLGTDAAELYAAVLDESQGDGKGYDRAFVDRNRNGRIDADESFMARMVENNTLRVGPVELRRSIRGRVIPWPVLIEWGQGERDPHPMTVVGFMRTGYATLGGKQVKVGLVDDNLRGRFSLRFEGDIVVDENDNGQLDLDFGEDVVIGKYFRYKNRFYRLQVDEHGAWMRIDDSEVAVGKLSSPLKDSSLEFYDREGCLGIETDSDGNAEAPIGTWWWYSYSVRFQRDSEIWTVRGHNSRNPILECEVRPGQTVRLPALQITPKLVVSVVGREVRLEYKLVGRWDEQVDYVHQIYQTGPPKPKLVLSGPDGKTLAVLALKPDIASSYQLSWTAPEGLAGEITAIVNWELGPLPLAKMTPVLFSLP